MNSIINPKYFKQKKKDWKESNCKEAPLKNYFWETWEKTKKDQR